MPNQNKRKILTFLNVSNLMNKLLFIVFETKYILIEGHVLHSWLDSLKLKAKGTNLMKNILLHTDLGIANTKMNIFFIDQIEIYFLEVGHQDE
jgi:hypothetical protein